MLFSDEKITVNMEDTNGTEEFDEDVLHMRQLLKTKLSDQDLSVRALNCLKAADVDTVGDLVKLNRNDLLKFRNFRQEVAHGAGRVADLAQPEVRYGRINLQT